MNRSTDDLLVTDNQGLSPVDPETGYLIDPATYGWQLIGTQPGSRASDNKKTLAKEMDFALGAFSENTYRSYRSDWRDFLDFCQDHQRSPLPCSLETLSSYFTERSATCKVSTLKRRLASIKLHHQRLNFRIDTQHPRFADVWRGICRRLGCAPDKKMPLKFERMRRILAQLDDTLVGLRNKAILLFGFATACRRSEIVAFKIGDLRFVDEGIEVTLRRSKTDQEGQSRKIPLPYGKAADGLTCPVTAVRKWLRAAPAEPETALFRAIDRYGYVSTKHLNNRVIALIVKQSVELALQREGISREEANEIIRDFSGHSLRSGFATSAAQEGIEERLIQKQTGHKSIEVLRSYVRDGSLFTQNALLGMKF